MTSIPTHQAIMQNPSPRHVKAAQIAATPGGVTIRADMTYGVRSQSDPNTTYLVDSCAAFRCTCPDRKAARAGECKHALAAKAVHRAIRKAEAAHAAGTLGDLEATGIAYKLSGDNEFQRCTGEIVRRACEIVRSRQAAQPATIELIRGGWPIDDERVSWGSRRPDEREVRAFERMLEEERYECDLDWQEPSSCSYPCEPGAAPTWRDYGFSGGAPFGVKGY